MLVTIVKPRTTQRSEGKARRVLDLRVLERGGCVVNVTEVLAVDVEDRPGGLVELLELVDDLAIEYMYAFTCGPDSRKATMVFRFEDPGRAIATLTSRGVNVVNSAELFSRARD